APPFQRAMSHYVIQVINFHATDYGQTLWGDTDEIGSFNPPKFATHIQVDCSYQDPIFYSRGIAGLKVTTAHEFQHSIQIGNYGYWYGENYFYEICAVWMETMVHPEVPDYLQYLSDSFGNPLGEFQTPDQTFVLGNGLIEYSRVVWAKYLRKRWSRDLMLHVWQNIPSYHTVQAMDHALGGVSSSFSQAFIEWGDWNYHTGSRSDTVKYYSEGNLFPEIALRPVLDYVSPSGFVIDSIEAISCAYQPVHYSTDFLERVTNLDINAPSPESTEGYTLQIDGSGGSGYTRLQNGLYVSLQVAHPENWSVVSTVPQSVTDAIAYPDPFFSSKSGALNFLFPQTSAVTATLQVMTQNMELVYKNSLPVNSNLGQSFVSWDAKNFHGDRLAAGIYIYSINAGGILYNGKFAVIR
ncbi:MAG TPA: hypothetical protein VKS81_01010, partial [Bacteroidota bacterium]|nr:hypothetical protein [Bacteroidota bacterium]